MRMVFFSVFLLFCVHTMRNLTMHTNFGNEFFRCFVFFSSNIVVHFFILVTFFSHIFFVTLYKKLKRESWVFFFVKKVSMSWFWFAFQINRLTLIQRRHNYNRVIAWESHIFNVHFHFFFLGSICFYLHSPIIGPVDKFDHFETKG